MGDEEAFLRAIGNAPADDLSRLGYADWLEERGDPRAAYLRLSVQAANRARESLPLDDLRPALRAALVTAPVEWRERVGPWVGGPRNLVAWRDLRTETFILTQPRCPCYCGGEGSLVLVACPACGTVMGRCDEVEELIRDVRSPAFDPENNICHPGVPCPECQSVLYGQFRAATEKELLALGLPRARFKKWRR